MSEDKKSSKNQQMQKHVQEHKYKFSCLVSPLLYKQLCMNVEYCTKL